MIKLISNIILIGSTCTFFACSTSQPEPIKLNVDQCDHCKMTVADLRFTSELITDKGRVYKFDDIACLLAYKKGNAEQQEKIFVADYNQPDDFLDAVNAIYVKGENIQSPMNGMVAAFADENAAKKFAGEKNANIVRWDEVNQ